MNTSGLSKREEMEEIDQLCLLLFDAWCEGRSIIPLAYLMYAWPISPPGPLAATRLSNTLQQLQRLHCESLTQRDQQVVRRVLLAINAYAGNNPEDVAR